MCEKAIEVQSLKIPIWGYCNLQLGDLFKTSQNNYVFDGGEYQPRTEGTVWLPRQDQLQEIIMKDSINIELNKFFVFSLEKRYNWHSDFEYPVFAVFRFDTFEQLWLAYVMKCKFNKVWSEEKQDWIEIN